MRDARTAGSVEFLLVDRQVRIHERGSSDYTALATHVLNEAGVDEESHIKLAFDPQSEKLTLHRLEVVRNGEIIEQFDRARISVLRREDSLENGILDGSLTLSILLEDVRQGDIVSYSFTTDQYHEVLGDRFSTTLSTQWSVPVRLAKIRVVHPSTRTFQLAQRISESPYETKVGNGWRELQWEWHDRPARTNEADRPDWHAHYPRLQISEYANWAQVVAWGLPLYRIEPASVEMRELTGKWMREFPDEADRIMSALRFVQDEIRYTGIEIGPSAYRPTSSAVVLKRRFGDCKDKAVLLISLLKQMGVQSHPALVNTSSLQGIRDFLPSPGAFDHVIVRLEHGGNAYWLDATRTLQGGQLDTIEQGRYGAALVIAEGSVDLETIPDASPSTPRTEVEETFDLRAGMSAVGLMNVKTIYRGAEADSARRRWQSKTPDETERQFLNFYRKSYPGVRAAKPVSFADDRRSNVLVITEAYELEPAFAKQDDESLLFYTNSHVVDDVARTPELASRTTPLALDFPVHVVHRIAVLLPKPWNAETDTKKITGPGFEYHSDLKYANARFDALYEFKTLADHIDAKDAPEYARKIKNVRDDTYYEFTHGGASSAANTPSGGGVSFGMLGAIVLGVLFSAASVMIIRHCDRWIRTRPANAGAPEGLRGWLLLPAIGTCLTPFALLVALYEHRAFVEPAVWSAIGAGTDYAGVLQMVLAIAIAIGMALVAASAYSIYLLFGKQRRFPFVYIAVLWAGLVWASITLVWAHVIDPSEQDLKSTISSIVRETLTSILWTTYMLRSQRVRATFIRSADELSALETPQASAAAA